MGWCKAVGALPLMGLNLGTGTPEQAAALVEYCNVEKGTKWSDLRRQHGIADPYGVRHWCLGNEMDGPWQIGHMTATEYGFKAADAARQMRSVDPSLKLVACGSSGPFMPTYLEWDREVLEQCYDYVDGLSLHRYFGNSQNETGGDSAKFLAMNLSMERQIAEIAAVCDMVRGHKRSPKKLWLSFDEWNVWYRATQRRRRRRPQKRSAAAAGRGLQPGRRAAGGRTDQFADAQRGPRQDRVPGAVGERDRAHHDQRERLVPADHLLSRTAGRCAMPRERS